MFKLPKCPYCGEEYSAKEVKKAANQKRLKCKKCEKRIKVKSAAGRIILAIVAFAVAFGLDFLFFFLFQNETVYMLCGVITVAVIYLIYLLLPYVCKFVKPDEATDDDQN